MSRMKLNLTGFSEAARDSRGKPLELDIGDVTEDPDQPRKEFDQASMQDLADSISARGVKTPISVHDDPGRPGKYIVNHGARRLRASLLCGKPTIPAFVDEVYDAYDQVIENLQRENLTPMELAMFIRKRMETGDKKGEIAKQLGKAPSVVSFHLALIDAPPCIDDAYTSGKCTSPTTLYELRNLHDKFPQQVDEWCAGEQEITRSTVTELASKFYHDKKSADAVEQKDDAKFYHDKKSEADKLRHGVKNNVVRAPKMPELAPVVRQHLTTGPFEKGADSSPLKQEFAPSQGDQDFVMTKFQMRAALSGKLENLATSSHVSIDELINQALEYFLK
jgi:ParB/RepB/Spo0J family partition protein